MGKYLADSYDAALRENADLKARLARELDGIKALEAVIVSRGARLAAAEALLREALAFIRWFHFGICRTRGFDGMPRQSHEIAKAIDDFFTADKPAAQPSATAP